MPTETVYGLAADVRNPKAIAAVFEAKGRPTTNPLIVHIGDPGDLDLVGEAISPCARKLAQAFWPGPLTLIVKRGAAIESTVTAGFDTVGVRMPAHPVALELLRAFGGPLAAPSANRYGAVSPTCAEHVESELGDRVSMVLDGGCCDVGIESTIVDVSGDQPIILRLGLITAAELEKTLGSKVSYAETLDVDAPGRARSHYKPAAKVYVVERDAIRAKLGELSGSGRRVGLVVRSRMEGLRGADHTQVVGDGRHAFARKIYDCLRFADSKGVDDVIVEPPGIGGVAEAVMDRLRRASF